MNTNNAIEVLFEQVEDRNAEDLQTPETAKWMLRKLVRNGAIATGRKGGRLDFAPSDLVKFMTERPADNPWLRVRVGAGANGEGGRVRGVTKIDGIIVSTSPQFVVTQMYVRELLGWLSNGILKVSFQVKRGRRVDRVCEVSQIRKIGARRGGVLKLDARTLYSFAIRGVPENLKARRLLAEYDLVAAGLWNYEAINYYVAHQMAHWFSGEALHPERWGDKMVDVWNAIVSGGGEKLEGVQELAYAEDGLVTARWFGEVGQPVELDEGHG